MRTELASRFWGFGAAPASASGKMGRSLPWWVNPAKLLLGFTVPVYILILGLLFAQETSAYINLQYRSPVYVHLGDIAGSFAVIAALAGGCAFGARFRTPRRGRRVPAPPRDLSVFGLDLLFAGTVIAYVVWFGPIAVANPQFVLDTLLGAPGASDRMRDTISTTPGVTTLTQFGVAYICIYGILRSAGNRKLKLRHALFAAIIVALAALRAILWSERIALLELVVPAAIIIVRYWPSPSRSVQILFATGPYLAALASPLVFLVFEINRSWVSHYNHVYNSLIRFSLDRMEVYFISSVNNGAGYLRYSQWPTYNGEFTFRWLFKSPLIGPFLQRLLNDNSFIDFQSFMTRFADIEFNNSTGIFPIVHDWGYLVAVALFSLMGVLIGRCYASFRDGSGVLGFIYPMMAYGILELLRIGYMNDSRFVVAVFGVYLFAAFSRIPSVRVTFTRQQGSFER
jgi:oligosaccharide repeat unit polymerase